MKNEIIKEAKKMLKEADSGTNECKIYNDGFIDGVNYAIQALRIHDVGGQSEQLVCDNHRADLEYFMNYSESICKTCKQKV